MKLSPVSENAILISLGDTISETLMPRLISLQRAAEQALGPALVDMVPSYTTLLCVYDLNQLDYLAAMQRLGTAIKRLDESNDGAISGKQIDIPVWYDPEVGYDLIDMSEQKGLSQEDIIALHTAKTYQVFAIGFMPGFGFMGKVDERLATARKATPRAAVAAGSVGIADVQTAVYPQQSPGGWNIIGRSPLTLFDAQRGDAHVSLLSVGDQVNFLSIDRQTFIEMGGHLG